VELNLTNLTYRHVEVENRHLMPELLNMKCCSVFYPSRYHHTLHNDDPRVVSFRNLKSPVNWSEAEHLIKEEGVYFFGGKDA
jgi:hypothetical protein